MKINENFPQPKFKIGQEVKILSDYTFEPSNDIWIIVQITLSCISVLSRLKKAPEPFDYTVIRKQDIGIPYISSSYREMVRESFIQEI